MRIAYIPLLLGLASSVLHTQTLTIRVQVPSDTPDSARLFIAGNLPALGSWRPDGLPMVKVDSTVWSAEVRVRKGVEAQFKVTLGSWDREALYVAGEVPANTIVRVDEDTTVSLFPVAWKQRTPQPAGGITGTVRYHRGVTGSELNYPRDIIVWLPPSYDSSTTRRYPVLYVQDGQNVFDPKASFSGYDWRVDEVADSLIRAGAMQEIIIVGIGNSPDRMEEYADTILGRAYVKFVARELKPMIDSLYRTKSERENTAVMGSSLGGLISFLSVWWRPDVFSKAACLSSSFFFGENKVFKEVRSATRLPRDIAIYLDCGAAERRLLPDYKRMHKLLKEKGLVEGKTLMGILDQGGGHNEQTWAKRVWRPLVFLFPH
jgi:enterochelin esterase-like enzyme